MTTTLTRTAFDALLAAHDAAEVDVTVERNPETGELFAVVAGSTVARTAVSR